MNFRRVRTLLPIPFWSCEIPSLSSLSFFFPPRKNDWIDLQFLLSLLKKNQFWTLSYVKGFSLWNQNRSIHLVFEFNPIRGKKNESESSLFGERTEFFTHLVGKREMISYRAMSTHTRQQRPLSHSARAPLCWLVLVDRPAGVISGSVICLPFRIPNSVCLAYLCIGTARHSRWYVIRPPWWVTHHYKVSTVDGPPL